MRCELLACVLIAGLPALVVAQRVDAGGGARPEAPSFLMEAGRSRVPVEAHAIPALRRRISLDLDDVPLERALTEIAERAGFRWIYSRDLVPLDRRVRLRAEDITVTAALTEALLDAGVDVLVLPRSSRGAVTQLGLTRRPARRQVGVVTGQVTDSATGQPVVSVQVGVVGTRLGAVTDDDGRYRIANVPAGSRRLRARRVGYAAREVDVVVLDGAIVTRDVVLAPLASRLAEIVTTVTGPQRRLEVGNVIGAIDADSVVRSAPVTSLSDLINARVPGTQVVLNNGLTGTTPRIRIRGLNSLTVANDPLLVVDGIRVENSTGSLGSGYGQTSGRLNDLNPEEIESIEIVKGPSAATLYGTDAANGVIVVTTKRGRPGRATWNAYAEGGLLEQPARFPDNYYAWGRNVGSGAVQQCVLTQAAAGVCQVDSLTTFNPLRNDETSPITTGNRQQYGLQVSGGIAQFTYFVASEYEGETGVLGMPGIDRARITDERGGSSLPDEQLRPNALRKVSLRGNAGTAIGSNADLNLAFGLVSSSIRIPGDAIFQAGIWGPGYRTTQDGWLGFLSRPGEAFAVRNTEDVSHYISSVNANWRPLPWLSTRATTGLDFSSTFLDGLQRRGEGPLGAGRNGRRLNTRSNVSQYTADVGASALLAPQARLTSRTSVGIQYNRRLQEVTTASGINLPPGSQTVTGAAVVTGAEQTVESVVAGAYAEQTMGLDERLFLTGALRADGGSAFGRDFRTALYPKASASWIALDQRTGALNSARLRAAYGASGVQPATTASLALITVAPALVDGVAATGARLGAIGNPNLKPERQTEFETGVDAELLNRRLRLEATYYDRLSRDALIDRPLASEFGLESRQENIGSVRNRGVEGLLSVTAVDNAVLAWDVSLNGSANRNRLERIGAGIDFIGPNPVLQNRQGYPLFSRFARPILGFSDANRNGIIEDNEVQVGDSLVYLGPAMPPQQLTASSSLTLLRGRLRVATQFDYRGGHRVVNYTEANRCGFFSNCQGVNNPTVLLAEQARAVAANSDRYGRTLEGYVESGSFVRWRELAVTWVMPDAFARGLRSRTASVTVTGRNLHLFTNYSGVDPEVNDAVGIGEGYGTNNPTSPPVRHWLLRVNLGL